MGRPLRLLIDCYELIRGRGLSTGIYNYALHLTAALQRSAAGDGIDLVAACNALNRPEFEEHAPGLRTEVLGPGPRSKVSKTAWDLGLASVALARLSPDVYFSPRGFAPLGIRRIAPGVVITVHDTIPFYYAAHVSTAFDRLQNRYITGRMRRSISTADLVVTVSQSSARAIAELSGRTRGVEVIYNGLRRCAARPSSARTHLFAMSSPLHHKNLQGVVAGYAAYVRRVADPLPLTVCGVTLDDCRRWTGEQEVLQRIRCVSGLSDAALDDLYATCAAFLFVSRVEGFGFPPLEALQAGARVVASDIPVHREVLGSSCRLVDPEDAEAIGRALAEASADRAGEPRTDLLERYRWDECAHRFAALVQRRFGTAAGS